MTEPTRPRSPMPVPPLLRDAAGWAWRLLLLALAGYLLVQLMTLLYFVTIPLLAALLTTALAYPLVRFLRHRHVPRPLAAWITVLVGLGLFGGIGFFVVERAIAEYPSLVDQVSAVVTEVRRFLIQTVHVKASTINNIGNTILNYLAQHRSSVASGVISGVGVVGEALAALVLWFFISFFLLYDGENIWGWIVGLFPATARDRVRGAGDRAWERLAGFVRGTFLIAVYHGVVVGITLLIMGVPLVAPLALLVFVGSFLPIVGAFVFGGLAVLVTLVTKNVILAVILLIVLVVDNQVEAHLLQPFLVGRYVRLHPLAIALVIAGGTVIEGIYGAVLAVPVAAVTYGVAKYLATSGRDGDRAVESGSTGRGGDSGDGGRRGDGGHRSDGDGRGDGDGDGAVRAAAADPAPEEKLVPETTG